MVSEYGSEYQLNINPGAGWEFRTNPSTVTRFSTTHRISITKCACWCQSNTKLTLQLIRDNTVLCQAKMETEEDKQELDYISFDKDVLIEPGFIYTLQFTYTNPYAEFSYRSEEPEMPYTAKPKENANNAKCDIKFIFHELGRNIWRAIYFKQF